MKRRRWSAPKTTHKILLYIYTLTLNFYLLILQSLPPSDRLSICPNQDDRNGFWLVVLRMSMCLEPVHQQDAWPQRTHATPSASSRWPGHPIPRGQRCTPLPTWRASRAMGCGASTAVPPPTRAPAPSGPHVYGRPSFQEEQPAPHRETSEWENGLEGGGQPEAAPGDGGAGVESCSEPEQLGALPGARAAAEATAPCTPQGAPGVALPRTPRERSSRSFASTPATPRRACPVMISYRVAETGEDGDGTVFRLQAALEARGYSVFVGEKAIVGAAKWPKTIQDGVLSCKAFVVLCSPTYGATEWTEAELSLAKNEGKPPCPCGTAALTRRPP